MARRDQKLAEREAAQQDAERQHASAVSSNEKLPVVKYTSKEPQSDRIYKVTHGLKYLPGVDGPLAEGMTFHPTERQVQSGSLTNKARELTSDEYARIGYRPKSFGVGIDLLGKIPMPEDVRALATEARLESADFEGLEPKGKGGQFTQKQVLDLIAAREERAVQT